MCPQGYGSGAGDSEHSHAVAAMESTASFGLILDRVARVCDQPGMLSAAIRQLAERVTQHDGPPLETDVKVPISDLVDFDTEVVDRSPAVNKAFNFYRCPRLHRYPVASVTS